MKTELKKQDNCQVSLTVTLDAEETKACVKEVEKAFMREARLPGFRPGKAPIEIVRKEFAAQLKEETLRTMFRKYYGDAVKAEGVEEVALADVKDFACTAESGSFTAIIDVKPEFKLPTYKGLKIAPAKTDVDEAAVTKQVESLRAAYAKYEDSKDGDVVQDGDFVQIDYSGTVSKKPILEVAPDAKVVASGEGFWTQVEEGRFLPEILEAVKGMKVGETKEGVKAKFSKESAPEPLKGKSAVYTVTLKALRSRVLPTDAELIEKTKSESIEKLTETIRTSMEKQTVDQEAARRENDAIELLLKKADFAVPESQVRHAMDHYLNNFAQQAQYAGLSADYLKEQKDQILKDAHDAAERQVRLWYVLDAICTAEKLEGGENERGKKAMEFVLANAK